jgi:hypothetical protein
VNEDENGDTGGDETGDHSSDEDSDENAPKAPVITRPKDGTVTKKLWIDVGGSADPKCTVQIYVNEVPRESTSSNPAGNFNISKVTLDDGGNEIYAVSTCPGGLPSPESNVVHVTAGDGKPQDFERFEKGPKAPGITHPKPSAQEKNKRLPEDTQER